MPVLGIIIIVLDVLTGLLAILALRPMRKALIDRAGREPAGNIMPGGSRASTTS